jgi:hypothetical protein
MTASELNDRFAAIYDAIGEQLGLLEGLRAQFTDDTWDEATGSNPIGDIVLDWEYEKQATDRVLTAWSSSKTA